MKPISHYRLTRSGRDRNSLRKNADMKNAQADNRRIVQLTVEGMLQVEKIFEFEKTINAIVANIIHSLFLITQLPIAFSISVIHPSSLDFGLTNEGLSVVVQS